MTRTPPARTRSLRFRLTAVATVVVTLVLAASAFALLVVQRRQLTANLDASLVQRADTVAAAFADDVTNTPLNSNDEDRAIQLVGTDGSVLVATSNLAGLPPLTTAPVDNADDVIETSDDLPLEDDSYRVLSRRIDTPEGPAVLHVAENSDDLEEAIRNLGLALAASIPVIAVLLAALTWGLTGRTLAPVDRLRAQVDAITAGNSNQRVQVPEHDDEIGRLATTMNHMLDRLTDANERQRRFVADAAHELRTPLTRIRANLDVDLAQPDTADPMATIETIHQETGELQQLVDDLLHLARSDAGQTPRYREPVDLDDIVMHEIRDLRAAQPTVMIDAGNVSAAHLAANPEHLRRAIRNVLVNAVRYADSTVSVTLNEHDTEIELSITDDGPGVPAVYREHIFERFTRIDDARTRDDGGTGLGLAITRDIIEDHGGTIEYDADHRDGARFILHLPAATDTPSK